MGTDTPAADTVELDGDCWNSAGGCEISANKVRAEVRKKKAVQNNRNSHTSAPSAAADCENIGELLRRVTLQPHPTRRLKHPNPQTRTCSPDSMSLTRMKNCWVDADADGFVTDSTPPPLLSSLLPRTLASICPCRSRARSRATAASTSPPLLTSASAAASSSKP